MKARAHAALVLAAVCLSGCADERPTAGRARPGSVAAHFPWEVPRELRAPATEFFTTWTRYRYGQTPASAISSVDPVVRSALDAIGPLPRTDLRHRPVRITGLRANVRDGQAVTVLATIDDGSGPYSQTATFSRRRGVWVVTTIQRPT